jgi:endoglucanase
MNRKERSWIAGMMVAFALVTTGAADSETKAPKLTVVGRQLRDPNGNAVQLHGWHQPAEPWHCGKGKFWRHGDYQGELRYFEEIVVTFTTHTPLYGCPHGWYFNQVRLGMDGADLDPSTATNVNMASLQKWTDGVLVPFTDYCEQHGVYVILLPLGCPEKSTTPELQKKMIQVWGYFSSHPKLKSKANLQFELCNEPVEARAANGSWGRSGQKYSDALVNWLQPVVDVIRSNGADNIIWIPGLAWQSEYKGFATKAVRGTNIGYAVHIYPAYGGVRDNPRALRKFWNAHYQPIADKAPINITEVWWARWFDEDAKEDPNRYGKLFDGITGDDKRGFGYALKSIAEREGNVSWCFHMTSHLLGKGPRADSADPQGVLNFADPKRDSAAVAAFNWSYEWRNTGPSDGVTNTAARPFNDGF